MNSNQLFLKFLLIFTILDWVIIVFEMGDIVFSELMYVDEKPVSKGNNGFVCRTGGQIYKMSDPCKDIKNNRDRIITNVLGKIILLLSIVVKI